MTTYSASLQQTTHKMSSRSYFHCVSKRCMLLWYVIRYVWSCATIRTIFEYGRYRYQSAEGQILGLGHHTKALRTQSPLDLLEGNTKSKTYIRSGTFLGILSLMYGVSTFNNNALVLYECTKYNIFRWIPLSTGSSEGKLLCWPIIQDNYSNIYSVYHIPMHRHSRLSSRA